MVALSYVRASCYAGENNAFHRWCWRMTRNDTYLPDLESLCDLCTPWCMHVVGTLRIADLIASGTNEIDDLAAAADCDRYALLQVLNHLVGRGVFETPEPGRFALNAVSQDLLDPRLRPDLNGIGGRFAYAWGTLPHYVRTGESGYAGLFGRPYWDDLAAHPHLAESFDELMGPSGHGRPDPDFPLSDGWENVRTIVDVGGGTGSMLAELVASRPGTAGVLVDLPGTVARSGDIFRSVGVEDRVTVSGQSFFDPLPAGAELYLLCKVLGNWPDKETVSLLRRCAEAMKPDSRLVVLGGVLPDEAPGGLSIEMVLLGGKTNSLAEFRELAAEAGLEIAAASREPSGRYVVECRRRTT